MMLFRKSKVLKILREYERIYNQKIPEDVIGKVELQALLNIELEQLAIMYDNLKGYEYYHGAADGMDVCVQYNMPDRSRFAPSFRFVPPAASIQHAVRVFKNVKFLQRNTFLAPELYARSDVVFIKGGSTCWKQHT